MLSVYSDRVVGEYGGLRCLSLGRLDITLFPVRYFGTLLAKNRAGRCGYLGILLLSV